MKNIGSYLKFAILVFGSFGLILYIGNVLVIAEKFSFGEKPLEIFIAVFLILLPFAFLAIHFFQITSRYRSNCINNEMEKLKKECEKNNSGPVENRFREILDTYTTDDASPQPVREFVKLCRNKELSPWEQIECIKKFYQECRKYALESGRKTAFLAAVSVVLSPSSTGDKLALLFWNVRLISDIIAIYKFRPKIRQLFAIYSAILFRSYLVGSVQDIMDELDNIPGLNKIPLMNLGVQAITSYFTLSRTAYLVCYYMENGTSPDVRNKARKDARNYALKNLVNFLPELSNIKGLNSRILTDVWNKLTDWFKRAKPADTPEEDDDNPFKNVYRETNS